MSAASEISTVRTGWPLMSMPRMSAAFASASSAVGANFTPPALPRPPVLTCALTMTGRPSRSAAGRPSPFGGGAHLVDGRDDHLLGRRDAVLCEELFGLPLEQVHEWRGYRRALRRRRRAGRGRRPRRRCWSSWCRV